eukprot:SAG11_NODE_76_length_18005_cov_6.523958_2_plen_141_part_00
MLPRTLPKNARLAHTLLARGEIERFKRCKFQAAVLRIETERDVAAGVAEVVADKKVRKATHPHIAAWCVDGENGFDDCGESGAGRKLLTLLEKRRASSTLVVVSRWYGGSHLGAARFRAISNCAKNLLVAVAAEAARSQA